MPVANDPTAPKGGRGPKGGKKPGPVVVLPPAPTPPVRPPTPPRDGGGRTPPPLGGGGSASGTRSSGYSSSSSSASNDYAAAQRKRDSAARDRYVEDARQMEGQISALRAALGPKGEFKDALRKRLRNIETVFGQQMDDLDKAEAAREGSLNKDASNNEMAAGDGTTEVNANRTRERASALSEIAMQGGGESDGLRSQLMSLRSGAANQSEVNRAFHDGQRSINNSRIDLALDTHNARVNMTTEANADKEQLWTTFYNQTSETQTQLGNALGQQAEYYGLAIESNTNAGGGGGGRGKRGKGKGGRGGNDRDGKGGSSWTATPDRGRDIEGTRLGRPSVDPDFNAVSGTRPSPLGSWETDGGGRDGGTGGGRGKGRGRGRSFGPGLRGDQDRAGAASDRAFMAAAQSQGRAWRNPGLPDELRDWQAPVPEEKQLTSSLLQSARTTQVQKAPEGATLRKW